MKIWGELYAKLDSKKQLVPVIDLLIASTAINYNLILVTRNIKDFVNIDCELLNPWDLNI